MQTEIDRNIKKAIEDFGFRSSVPIFKALEGDNADHLPLPNVREIDIAGGHRLRIIGSYDPEALSRLIRGLSA